MKQRQKQNDTRSPTRRGFLKAAALAAPLVLAGRVLGLDGAVAPSNRITMGMIGVGDHGVGRNMNLLFQQNDAQIIAVCDVDPTRRDRAAVLANQHYTKALKAVGGYSGCDALTDFREIIARKDIDAVCVSTPDHWHVIPAILAVRSGKDVICEKPLTLTIAEGRMLADDVKRYGRVFQTSSENRSIPTYRRLCEIIRNGRIGKLKRIEVGLPSGGRGPANVEYTDPPPGFDYNMWLGQAPVAPYCAARIHWNFRWIFDYSGGMLTDWGAHMIDLAQWGHNTEYTGPLTVEGTGEVAPHSLYDTYTQFDLQYTFADGVEMRVVSRQPYLRFEGTDGWVASDGWRGPLKASSASILLDPIRPGETHLYSAIEDGEHRNFLDCVKSRRACYGPAEIGHRSISIAHLGNISLRLGRKLRWNPDAERFIEDDAANRMLSRAMRQPWSL